ncbi:MAG TPA: tlde1 domain-containing protein [Roseiarcus sp.]|nr:tlde1 domain-containing protein [Roseiarcus sp.]
MTHWTDAAELIGDRDCGAQRMGAQGLAARYAPGALAFALSAALGVYLVYLRPFLHAPAPMTSPAAEASPFGSLVALAPPFGSLVALAPPPSPVAATPAAVNKPAVAEPAPQAVANPFGALVIKGFGSAARFDIAEAPVPLPPAPPADLRPIEEAAAPLPPRRPTVLASLEAPEADARSRPSATPEAPKPAATPGIFEKLFGDAGSRAAKTPALAYAAPPPVSGSGSVALAGRSGMSGSSGGFGNFLRGLSFGSNPTSRFGDHVAVYDISARAVYLPDGTRLEAHSGLGVARDDPSKVSERMRGATPPATYALSPREELFHGVAALRLTPIGSNIYGRAGLLAHTYMLGPDGDSNGCVSFRNYDAFLRAFRNGAITKLVVVSRL